MINIEEASTWTTEEVLEKLQEAIPPSWKFEHALVENWCHAAIMDGEGEILWSGENVDPRVLFLEALGWYLVKDHKPTNPAWRPRDREVPLHRPTTLETIPDPGDLDPDEVAAVYKDEKDR